MDAHAAFRRFERFLFLTPHDEKEDEGEDILIATIKYDHEKKTVTVVREDDKDNPIEM